MRIKGVKAFGTLGKGLTYDNSINIILLTAMGRKKLVRAGGIIVGLNVAILLHVAHWMILVRSPLLLFPLFLETIVSSMLKYTQILH